jgi:uncharacterized protein YkwD
MAAAALAAGLGHASDLPEERFLALLNAERIAAGRPALEPEPAMHELARTWADTQAASQRLAHRPQQNQVEWVESQVTRRWQRVAENVGYGGSVDAVHRALMASPAHRANALGDFTHVGVGAASDATGRIWVTFNFLKAP